MEYSKLQTPREEIGALVESFFEMDTELFGNEVQEGAWNAKVRYEPTLDNMVCDISYDGLLCCEMALLSSFSVEITENANCGYENHQSVCQAVIEALEELHIHVKNSSEFFPEKESSMKKLYDALCDNGYLQEGNPSFESFDSDFVSLIISSEVESYEGGFDSDGHERKANFSVQNVDTTFCIQLDGNWKVFHETDEKDYPTVSTEKIPYLLRMVEEATNHETPLILHQFSEPECSCYQTLTQNKELAQVRQDERIIRNHFNGNNWRFVELEEFLNCQINAKMLKNIGDEIEMTLAQMPPETLNAFTKEYAKKDNSNKKINQERI